jgi:aquaporin TIP
MKDGWQRSALVELVGVFGLVWISAGVVCINHMTTPDHAQAGTAPLTLHQPGLFGVALAQGAILAVLLAVTVPISGGYLNPAVTVTLWAFGLLGSRKAGVLLVAQLLGSVLGAGCLWLIFTGNIVQTAHFGTPHINPLAYPSPSQPAVLAGSGVELLLTFFLVLAMFAALGQSSDPWRFGLAPGMVQAAAVLVGFPLTGAALNPARWLGPVLWEAMSRSETGPNPWTDFLVYLAGPVIGALLAGWFWLRVMAAPERPKSPAARK